MNKSILLAISEKGLADRIRNIIESSGYLVHLVEHVSSALTLIQQVTFVMLIVDSHLSGMQDFDFVRRIQKGEQRIPIMVLGYDGSEEAAAALEAGANDYISGQTDERELLARVNNLLLLFSYGTSQRNQVIELGDLVIDPLSRQVTREDIPIDLTQREYDLLLYLSKKVNQVCSREDILNQVWDYDFHTGTNVVDVYILHLREKLDKGRKTKLIRTIRGAGYMLRTQEVT
ncbi:response regulator transcription factor [Paenibacillus dakarensis]|uniref:response regulator transcription factor n=1 Tax=Paenibacillus dakarensis TaxID=1527293 RepID=UPI0006D544F7|nr:response regulator transcription factor [Paenibacillus dakarensis]